eukprot:scaffold2727_cov140-Isochrysis_galbana.AAC.3
MHSNARMHLHSFHILLRDATGSCHGSVTRARRRAHGRTRRHLLAWQMGRQCDPAPPPSHGYLPGCRGDGRCSDGAMRQQPPLWASDRGHQSRGRARSEKVTCSL